MSTQVYHLSTQVHTVGTQVYKTPCFPFAENPPLPITDPAGSWAEGMIQSTLVVTCDLARSCS